MRDLTTGLVMLLGIGLFIAATWAGCSAYLKNNEAYERGVAVALEDPVLQAALGAPVEEGWFLNGSIQGGGGTSRGAWSVRLRGADGGGTLYVQGAKASGEWRVVGLSAEVGGERYDYVPERGFVRAKPDTHGPGPRDITGAGG